MTDQKPIVQAALYGLALVLPLAAFAQTATPTPTPPVAPGPVAFQVCATGLSSLTVAGTQWLGTRSKPPLVGDFSAAVWRNGAPETAYEPRLTATLSGNSTVQTYAWGKTTCTYSLVDQHTLRFDISVTNTDSTPLTGIQLSLGDVHFPDYATPQYWNNNAPPSADNTNNPAVLVGDYGTGILAFINEKVGETEPTAFMFRYWNGYPLRVSAAKPLAAGGTKTFQLSLRWSAEGTTKAQIAPAVWGTFQALRSQELNWPDRCPIGSVYLAAVNRGYANNPRGWLNDQFLNINTPAGLAEFKTRLYQIATDSVTYMQQMNSQGCIVWDVEGEQFPQGIATYIGDPTRLKEFAPEMDPIVDGFFKILKDSGRRIGVTLRCQYMAPYSQGGWVQNEYTTDDAIFNALDQRIIYAQQRWGCSLFYLDSNGGVNGLYSVNIFQKLMEKHPDVLLIPEAQNLSYYAYTAPYDEIRDLPGIPGTTATSPNIKAVLSGAFTVLNTSDAPIAANRAKLVLGVRGGDILMYRTWFNSAELSQVKSIYAEANGTGGPVANSDAYVVKGGADTILDSNVNDFTLSSGRVAAYVTGVTQPASGSAYLQNGAVHYVAPATPPANGATTFTFNYTISDGVSTSTAPITVNVNQ